MLDNERVSQYTSHSSQSAHEHLFELFLFINPLDRNSLEAEKELLYFIKQSKANVYFRLICYHDYPCIQELMQKQKGTHHTTEECNQLFLAIYQMALSYKAALFQGKKRGRQMLLAMQEYFINEEQAFSNDDMKAIAASVGLDVDMWLEDLHSDRVRRDYQEDMRLARQMNIITQPSLVVFDSLNFEYGVKVENIMSATEIEELLTDLASSTEQLMNDNNTVSPCPLHAVKNRYYQ
ncbi:MAG: DsbA family protein [Aerococcus sp.]|nr:DsbA family protein [Aerococcus sp.]